MSEAVEVKIIPKTWQIGRVTFEWHDQYGNGVSKFDDGLELIAAPNFDSGSVTTAVQLGYENSPEGLSNMCCEHELLHHFLAVSVGFPWSPTLHSVANGLKNIGAAVEFPLNDQYREEQDVLNLQKCVNDLRSSRLRGVNPVVTAALAFLSQREAGEWAERGVRAMRLASVSRSAIADAMKEARRVAGIPSSGGDIMDTVGDDGFGALDDNWRRG